MTDFTVTATGTDALGRTVTGSATAVLLRTSPRRGVTETIEVKVDARRLLVFAELVERHAAAIRRDLERFMAGGEPDGFGWFERDGGEGSGM